MNLSRYWTTLIAVGKLGLYNLNLSYYWLPRSWRGGYRSPWEMKRQL